LKEKLKALPIPEEKKKWMGRAAPKPKKPKKRLFSAGQIRSLERVRSAVYTRNLKKDEFPFQN
jgi:hypothetical protein